MRRKTLQDYGDQKKFLYCHLSKNITDRWVNTIILLGNPGVSKSWFHWYLLYVIASKKVGPGLHVDISDQPPTVVVRQNASSYMTYYFPQTEEPQVYETEQVTPTLLRCLDPSTTLYLFEPGSALIHRIIYWQDNCNMLSG